MKYQGHIYLDHLGRAWLRLPGQREPMLLEDAQSLLIYEMIHPFAIQYQQVLYRRGYAMRRSWGRRKFATLLH